MADGAVLRTERFIFPKEDDIKKSLGAKTLPLSPPGPDGRGPMTYKPEVRLDLTFPTVNSALF
jgi:hypothetical protein